jgi:phage tail protein X
MKTYKTQQGDTWDLISYRLTGSTNQTVALLSANPDLVDVFIFDDGVLLQVPDFDTEADTSKYPPWRSAQ